MKGLVIKSTGSWYIVRLENKKTIPCRIRGKFRTKDIKNTNPVSVGDIVDIEIFTEENTGNIINIHPRNNYIIRKSSKLSKQYHIIASNIDQALLIATLKAPLIHLEFVDRFLITCEAYRIPAVIIFNKIDILTDEELEEVKKLSTMYNKIGYKTILSSFEKNIGISEIQEIIQNKTSLLSGYSGVGKSTLINLLEPSLKLKTSDISESYKTGKHTTTFAEIFELSIGGFIIDTPGIKSFGLIDIDKEELYHFFPEIFRAADKCKFNNCKHVNEPGCNVVFMLKKGDISQYRYESYLRILFDENEKYRGKY